MSTKESTVDRSRPSQARHRVSRRAVLATGAAGFTTAMLLNAQSSLAAQEAEGSATPDPDQSLRLPLYPYGQPIYLDPHRATNWGPHWILLPHVWAGLLRFDEHGAVANDLASSIEPDEAGQVWTIEIRSDATFASGNPVTADALIQGWMRALDPQHLAPTSQFMSRVEGYDAFIAGESEEIGFEAQSETSVAIHLASPYAHFPEELATFVWAAVDVAALEGVPGSEVPFADAGAGSWRFAASDDAATILMEPNPNASSDPPTGLTTVMWQSMSGAHSTEAAIDLFQQDALAIADVTGALAQLPQDDASLQESVHTIEVSGSTMLIGMDFNQAPFNDIRVRQAVAASIDRAAWAKDIQGGAFTEATSITPPVLAESANYVAPSPLAFDPDQARSLLADAGIEESTQPPITWFLRADAPDAERDQANALIEMIRTNSGLVIELDTSLTLDQIEAMRADNGGLQLDLRWWWPFTSSPSGLADLAAAESPSMAGWFNWSTELESEDAAAAAELFNTTVADAATNMDRTQRVQAYAEAEKLLIDNAVYIPLGHGVQSYLQSPRLTGTRQGAFTGYAPLVLDGDVVYEPDTGTPSAEE